MVLSNTIDNAKQSFGYLYREIASGRMPNLRDNYALEKYINYIVNRPEYIPPGGEIHEAVDRTISLPHFNMWMDDDIFIDEIPLEHFEVVKTYFYKIDQNGRYGFEHPHAQKYVMDVRESIDIICEQMGDYNDYFYWIKNCN